jgi:hypothetical protein
MGAHNFNYYSTALIPLGVVFYLMIKFGADFRISNRGLVLHHTAAETLEFEKIRDRVLGMIKKSHKLNDSVFMIKNLPIRLNEITNLYDTGFMKAQLRFNEIKVFHDFVWPKEQKDYSNGFITRVIYDQFMKYDNFSLSGNDKFPDILGKNSILEEKYITLNNLSTPEKNVRISVLNHSNNSKHFESRKSYLGKGNALMLFISLNNFVDVINC